LRKLLVQIKSALPVDLQTYFQPVIYGLTGGFAAVAFQRLIQILFAVLWSGPSGWYKIGFGLWSLFAIVISSLLAGLILTFVSKDAVIPPFARVTWQLYLVCLVSGTKT
jgi:hypothetical protein